jgi:MFS transporter, SP family, arabinose:H+ symporter
VLSVVTPDIAVLLLARTLIGVATGSDSAIATVCIAEFAPKNRHGSLALLQQWMVIVGAMGGLPDRPGHLSVPPDPALHH